jgi:hypothetical protein
MNKANIQKKSWYSIILVWRSFDPQITIKMSLITRSYVEPLFTVAMPRPRTTVWRPSSFRFTVHARRRWTRFKGPSPACSEPSPTRSVPAALVVSRRDGTAKAPVDSGAAQPNGWPCWCLETGPLSAAGGQSLITGVPSSCNYPERTGTTNIHLVSYIKPIQMASIPFWAFFFDTQWFYFIKCRV